MGKHWQKNIRWIALFAMVISMMQGFVVQEAHAEPETEYEWKNVNSDLGVITNLYYENGTYYAVAYSSKNWKTSVLASTDLETWTPILTDQYDVSALSFIGSDIYATGRVDNNNKSSMILKRGADNNWVRFTNMQENASLSAIAFNGDKQYVMAQNNSYNLYYLTSTGGLKDNTWSKYSRSDSYRFEDVVFDPTSRKFFAADWKGAVGYSTNGTTDWTFVTLERKDQPSNSQIEDLLVAGKKVLAAGPIGVWEVASNGTVGTKKLLTGNYYALAFDGTTYVASGYVKSGGNNYGLISTSTDLVNWTHTRIDSTANIFSITSGSQGIIAGSSNGFYRWLPKDQPASITSHPVDQLANIGGTATFSVTAAGTNLKYQWQAAAGATAPFINIPNANGATLQISNVTAQMNGYRYRVSITGAVGAAATSNEAKLSVIAPTEITRDPLDLTTVEGETATFQVTAAGTGLNYGWKISRDGGGSYESLSGYNSAIVSIPNISLNDNGNRYLAEVSGADSLTKSSQPAKLTVYPKSAFNPVQEAVVMAGENAVIANLAPVNGMSYQWQVNRGNGFVNLDGAASASLTLQNVTSDMDTYKYRLVVSGAMTYTSSEAKLTVNVPTAITSQPGNAVTYAGQDAVFHVSAAGRNLTYQWFVDTTGSEPGDFTALPDGTSATLTVRNTDPSMNGYRYKVVVSGNGMAPVESSAAALKVFAVSELQPLGITTVADEPAVIKVPAGSEPGLTYRWQVDTGSGFADIQDANGHQLDLGNVSADRNGYNYRVVIGGAMQPEFVSAAAKLTVYDKSAFELHEVSVIAGQDATLAITAAGTGLTYQWFVDTSGTGNDFEPIPNNDSPTLQLPGVTTEMEGYKYRVIVSGALSPVYASNTIALNVYEAADFLPEAVTAIAGQTATFSVTGAGPGLTYQWQAQTGTGSFADIPNATGATLRVENVTTEMSGYKYRVVIGGAMQAAYESPAAALTVYDRSGFRPETITTMAGQNAVFSASGTAAGLSFQWQTDNGTGSFADIADATGPNLELENVTVGMNGYQYRLVVSGALQTPYVSEAAVLAVYDSSALQPASVTAIAGQGASFTVPTAGTGLTYQWQVDAGTGSFANLANETGATLQLANVTTGMNGYNYRVIVGGALQTPFTSDDVSLTVYDPSGLQPAPATAIAGQTASFSVSEPKDGLTYQWQVDDGSGSFSNITGATDPALQLDNVTAGMNGYKYRVVVGGELQMPYTSGDVTLTVYATSGLQPASATAIAGQNTAFSVSEPKNGLLYQWQVDDGNGVFEDIPSATGSTLQLDTVTQEMNSYNYRVVIGGTLQTPFISDDVTLTVYDPSGLQPSPAKVVAGQNATFSVTDPKDGLTYQWQVDSGSGSFSSIAGATDPTLQLDNVAAGMNGYNYRVVIGGALQTPYTSDDVTLAVYAASGLQPAPATAVAGQNAAFSVSEPKDGLTYQWQVDDGSGTFADISDATDPTLQLDNVTTGMNSYKYRVVIGGTLQTPFTSNAVTLTVYAPTGLQPAPATAIAGQTATFSVSEPKDGLTYQWQVDGGNGTFTDITSATTPTLQLDNTTTAMNGYKYRVVVSGALQAPFTSDDVTLTVYDTSGLEPAPAKVVAGQNAAFSVSEPKNGLTYQWQVDDGSGSFSNIAGGTDPALQLDNVTAGMNGYKYRVVVGGELQTPYTSGDVTLTVYATSGLQPSSATAIAGQTASLSVSEPKDELSYQWQVDDGNGTFTDIADAIAPTLQLNNTATPMNGYKYRVVVSGALQTPFTSDDVTLTVYDPSGLQPAPATAVAGQNAAFSVTEPKDGLTYQWQSDNGSGIFTDIAGATASTLQLDNATTTMNGYKYRVVVSGALQTPFTSDDVTLTVYDPFGLQPAPATTVAGQNADFSLTEPKDGLTYQWQVDDSSGTFADIPNATGPALQLDNVTPEMSSYKYRVVIGGTLQTPYTSNAVTLNVYAPTGLQPAPATAIAGQTATFSVSEPKDGLTYQWQSDDGSGTFTNIDGATSPEIQLETVTTEMNGYKYRVVIGGVLQTPYTSDEVTLTVIAPPGVPTGVSATAGNGIAVIHFTPPASNGGTAITEYKVTASPGGLTAVGTASPITVSGLSNGTTYTFTVAASNAAGTGETSASSNGIVPYVPIVPDTPSEPANTENPSAAQDAEVWVNGKVERAGQARTSSKNGQTVTTVSIDEKKLEERLAAEGAHAVITIPVNAKSNVVIGELNGKMVKGMEQQQAVVEILTSSASYTLPAGQINIDAISAQIGRTVPLEDIKVRIEIAAPAADAVQIVEDAAAKGNFTLVAPPLQFTVTAVYGDTVIDVSTFNSYVERTIAIPEGTDPAKITTGVVIDPDGTVRHVPTKIILLEGNYYAQINSLTNSLYSVVWHPLEFADVASHWSKDAVNDMGSRMIVSGIGDSLFQPDRSITRAEFAAIVVSALGLKPKKGAAPFTDVRESDWYNDAIATASSYKLISGFEDNTFRPLDEITREQAMTIVAKAMRITGMTADLLPQAADELLLAFQDGTSVSAWAKNGIAAALSAGIISGRTATELSPQESITRAEVAVLIQRLLQKSDLI